MTATRASTRTARTSNLLPLSGFRDPLSVSGLLAWYDLSDSSLLATSNNGTGAVTNGSTVGYAADKSGNGWHLTQGTANNRPTWNGSANGRTVLTFDGTNDVLSSSSLWPLTGDPATTLFAVHARAVTTSGQPLSWGTRTGGNINITDDSVARIGVGLGGGTTMFTTPSSAVNTPQLFSMIRQSKPASTTTSARPTYPFTGYRNGANINLNTATAVVAAGPLNIGLTVGGPSYHNGIICEVLIYSRDLTETEHRNVVLWLGSRWGLTIT
jgi:hypothetical protein